MWQSIQVCACMLNCGQTLWVCWYAARVQMDTAILGLIRAIPMHPPCIIATLWYASSFDRMNWCFLKSSTELLIELKLLLIIRYVQNISNTVILNISKPKPSCTGLLKGSLSACILYNKYASTRDSNWISQWAKQIFVWSQRSWLSKQLLSVNCIMRVIDISKKKSAHIPVLSSSSFAKSL